MTMTPRLRRVSRTPRCGVRPTEFPRAAGGPPPRSTRRSTAPGAYILAVSGRIMSKAKPWEEIVNSAPVAGVSIIPDVGTSRPRHSFMEIRTNKFGRDHRESGKREPRTARRNPRHRVTPSEPRLVHRSFGHPTAYEPNGTITSTLVQAVRRTPTESLGYDPRPPDSRKRTRSRNPDPRANRQNEPRAGCDERDQEPSRKRTQGRGQR